MLRNPIILMCFHRSGSTYLTRLLNSNPQVMIWGEHGGFISKLLESSEALNKRLFKSSQRTDISAAKAECVNSFIPFMNCFTIEQYEQQLAGVIHNLYSANLEPNTRWGFKEVRYLSDEMVDFFVRLFPEVKFCFVMRNIVDLCIANLRAPWVIERLSRGYNGYDHTKLREVIYNILVRIRMHHQQFDYAREKYPRNTVLVEYEALTEDPYNEMVRISEALDIRTAVSRDAVIKTTAYKIGAGVYEPTPDCPELEINTLFNEISSLTREIDRYTVLPYLPINDTWNFCMGIMPTDAFSFQR